VRFQLLTFPTFKLKIVLRSITVAIAPICAAAAWCSALAQAAVASAGVSPHFDFTFCTVS
jgi:hypothetical protein